MFWNPPTREEFGNAQFLGPRSPLWFELSNDIPNTSLHDFARDVLISVSSVVIASWKDAHPHEPACSCRSEIACGEGSSSVVRLIEDSEGKRMYGPDERIRTRRTQVAGIFVQEGTCQKLGRVSGRMICHSVSIVPAECACAVFPFLRIFARWVAHSQARPKGRPHAGGGTQGFMSVVMKFILTTHNSPGHTL